MEQRIDLKRLADEVVCAALDGVHRVFERAVTRDDDRDDIWIAFDGGFDDARTIDAGQTQVGDDDVERKIREARDGSVAGLGLFDEVPVVGELFGNGLAEWSLVFDDQEMSWPLSHLRGRQDFDTGSGSCPQLMSFMKNA